MQRSDQNFNVIVAYANCNHEKDKYQSSMPPSDAPRGTQRGMRVLAGMAQSPSLGRLFAADTSFSRLEEVRKG